MPKKTGPTFSGVDAGFGDRATFALRRSDGSLIGAFASDRGDPGTNATFSLESLREMEKRARAREEALELAELLQGLQQQSAVLNYEISGILGRNTENLALIMMDRHSADWDRIHLGIEGLCSIFLEMQKAGQLSLTFFDPMPIEKVMPGRQHTIKR